MTGGLAGARATGAILAVLVLAHPLPAQDGEAPGRPDRAAVSADPGVPSDSAAARREVLEVLDRMARAMAARDTAALVGLFLPGARLVGMRPREGGPALQALTAAQFAEFMARDRRETWIERMHDPEVRIDGTLATVWVRYDFSFGDRLSHCGTDAFQLLRTDAGWRIASLADTYRTEGC
ncbi:MAG TPA: nuclear transport factor 2 family protein [Gemmatimonadales bacterium]|nr:nuclear transport factor 2 family protein [Gemmatimonadales bacterium]